MQTAKTIKRLFEDPRAGWDALTDLLAFGLFIWAMALFIGWVL